MASTPAGAAGEPPGAAAAEAGGYFSLRGSCADGWSSSQHRRDLSGGPEDHQQSSFYSREQEEDDSSSMLQSPAVTVSVQDLFSHKFAGGTRSHENSASTLASEEEADEEEAPQYSQEHDMQGSQSVPAGGEEEQPEAPLLLYDSFFTEPPSLSKLGSSANAFISPSPATSSANQAAKAFALDPSRSSGYESSSSDDSLTDRRRASAKGLQLNRQWAAMKRKDALAAATSTDGNVQVDAPPRSRPSLFHSEDSSSSHFAHLRSYEWLEDDTAEGCMSCNRTFDLLQRRHHCRGCGGIFCQACSPRKLLVQDPISCPKWRRADPAIPHRVCQRCEQDLLPYQSEMIAVVSNAQRANVTEDAGPWRFLNSPVAFSLGHEVRKASNSLANLCAGPEEFPPTLIRALGDQKFPLKLLSSAKGLIIVTALRVGAFYSAMGGTGLCVARLDDGSWSAPAAIAMGGVGWGGQFGVCVTDYVICLRTQEAVDMLMGSGMLSLNVDAALALGMVGRSGEVSMNFGAGVLSGDDRGKVSPPSPLQPAQPPPQQLQHKEKHLQPPLAASICTSYSLSKGLFVGVGVEGRVIFARPDVNCRFYGAEISTRQILSGTVPQPPAGLPLYSSLAQMERMFISAKARCLSP
jgi:lipid-binding SYLF domain-containing protein